MPTKLAPTSEVGKALSRQSHFPTTWRSIRPETSGSATDGAPGSISKADGLFRVPLEGDERGHLVQFLAVPYQAETCGPVIHDRDGSVFISVQHPGEEGSWDEQLSYFPDHVPAGAEPPELGVARDRASFR
jgi:secreted PhoX family phosphatase